jgi:hypothetical protein
VTGVFVFVVYAAAAPVRLRFTGGISLPPDGIALGWVVSAVGHLTVFTLVYLVLAAAGALASLPTLRWPARTLHEWLLGMVAAGAVTWILLRMMLAPIGVRGPAAWVISTAMGVALAAAWSGMARHRSAASGASLSPLDAWLAPITLGRSPLACAVSLVIAPVAAHALIARLSIFDWEFMLQKLTTLGLWVAAFAFIHTLTGRKRTARRAAALVPGYRMAPVFVIGLFASEQLLLPRLPALDGGNASNAEFVLDGYAAVDPSFRITRDVLVSGPNADAADFYAYLRRHSAIGSSQLEPVDIDFVRHWSDSSARPPHVFLFIIDSLRPDYLSAYNEKVTFTPAIEAFAEDSFVFERAFSRYAGTGLSVPAIWAGSMLIHKQYVTPFAPMNALEKLLTAKGYQQFITEDHLTDALFSPSAAMTALDRNVPEMLHTFCRTLGELGEKLRAPGFDRGRPLFAMTRPLDLHIGNIASATAPAGETYPGFHAPYASRVRRIDACFGEFVDTLKALELYDDSLIVITSDHGDSLGEGQRWGHGFTAFPEVLRIPLLIRLPEGLRRSASTDTTRVSFSTDLTPTLYALVGERLPPQEGPRSVRDRLLGSPLFVDPSTDDSWRRRESYLVASSYGPVYGLIGQNGRRLYLADGVESREYAYDLEADGTAVRVGLTDAERDAHRRAIREQIAELAAWYRFVPES